MGLTKMSSKVLIAGDTCGQFAKLMKSLGSANAKAGPFDACFCVGGFFGADARRELIPYLTGQAKVLSLCLSLSLSLSLTHRHRSRCRRSSS